MRHKRAREKGPLASPAHTLRRKYLLPKSLPDLTIRLSLLRGSSVSLRRINVAYTFARHEFSRAALASAERKVREVLSGDPSTSNIPKLAYITSAREFGALHSLRYIEIRKVSHAPSNFRVFLAFPRIVSGSQRKRSCIQLGAPLK